MKTQTNPTVAPFFARNTQDRSINVRSGIQAGLTEQKFKLI